MAKNKEKRPFYKKWWFWLIAVVVVIGMLGEEESPVTDSTSPTNQEEVAGDNSTIESDNEITQESVATTAPQEETPVVDSSENSLNAEDKIPTEYKSALKKAQVYSDTMNMSKVGIYDQLTSEYGEQFSPEAAQYAIDNVDADWKENALKKAETYQETMAMSPNAIYDQLVSDYGEQFTSEEAQYAIDNLK